MPIVATSGLPAFNRISALPSDRAEHQKIRELHVGICNLMPDGALEATERQLLRLLGQSNTIAQIHPHMFTLPMIERGENARKHIESYYEDLATLQTQGLDALIVTGTNPLAYPDIRDKIFWKPMIDMVNWAKENVTSTLYSCMASHLVLTHNHGQVPTTTTEKTWGVFPHRIVDPSHPLVNGMNTRFDVPHSRLRDVSTAQFKGAGLRVLASGAEVGVHLATSHDGFRSVFMQGHPEYDTNSLLKEFKREATRFVQGEREDFPLVPKNYFNEEGLAIIEAYKSSILNGSAVDFPEEDLETTLDNTWGDSARALVSTWMGLVYQITDHDRSKPFMDGINPDDPLGLYAGKNSDTAVAGHREGPAVFTPARAGPR